MNASVRYRYALLDRNLNTPIRRRKSIANAAGNGMSVLEQTPRDDKAIAELNALLKAIY